ncbi:MAG TPA: zinc ribbon domain-containing protein [Gemmatimonadales bacterium]
MPIYDYHCTACGARFERLVRGTRKVACDCGSAEVERLMSLTARPASGAVPARAEAAPASRSGGCCGGGCHTHTH